MPRARWALRADALPAGHSPRGGDPHETGSRAYWSGRHESMAAFLRRMAAFREALADVLPDLCSILDADERRGLARYLLTPADGANQRFLERFELVCRAQAKGCTDEALIYEKREAEWAARGRKGGGSRHSGQAREAHRLNADLCLLHEVLMAALVGSEGAEPDARADALLGTLDFEDDAARAEVRAELRRIVGDPKRRTDETRARAALRVVGRAIASPLVKWRDVQMQAKDDPSNVLVATVPVSIPPGERQWSVAELADILDNDDGYSDDHLQQVLRDCRAARAPRTP